MQEKKITQIRVGRYTVGVVGLEPLMTELAETRPDADDEAIGAVMLERLETANYIPPSARSDYGAAFLREYRKFRGLPPTGGSEAFAGLDIKVLGQGCAQCDNLEQTLMELLTETAIPASLEHIRDIREIARYGVMTVPALLIDGKTVVRGSIPSKEKLRLLLMEAASGQA